VQKSFANHKYLSLGEFTLQRSPNLELIDTREHRIPETTECERKKGLQMKTFSPLSMGRKADSHMDSILVTRNWWFTFALSD